MVAGQLGPLAAVAGVAGEGAEVQALEFVAEVAPGVAGVGLGDPDQQQREPAEQHVRADPVFFAVVDRSQIEGGLHVAPRAFDLQELLVAQRDVLDGQGRVGGAQEELAVELLLGLDGGTVDPEQAGLGGADEPL